MVVVLGWQLDFMILEVFCNLYDSVNSVLVLLLSFLRFKYFPSEVVK